MAERRQGARRRARREPTQSLPASVVARSLSSLARNHPFAASTKLTSRNTSSEDTPLMFQLVSVLSGPTVISVVDRTTSRVESTTNEGSGNSPYLFGTCSTWAAFQVEPPSDVVEEDHRRLSAHR
jgi:hypothetical protein